MVSRVHCRVVFVLVGCAFLVGERLQLGVCAWVWACVWACVCVCARVCGRVAAVQCWVACAVVRCGVGVGGRVACWCSGVIMRRCAGEVRWVGACARLGGCDVSVGVCVLA